MGGIDLRCVGQNLIWFGRLYRVKAGRGRDIGMDVAGESLSAHPALSDESTSRRQLQVSNPRPIPMVSVVPVASIEPGHKRSFLLRL